MRVDVFRFYQHFKLFETGTKNKVSSALEQIKNKNCMELHQVMFWALYVAKLQRDLKPKGKRPQKIPTQ